MTLDVNDPSSIMGGYANEFSTSNALQLPDGVGGKRINKRVSVKKALIIGIDCEYELDDDLAVVNDDKTARDNNSKVEGKSNKIISYQASIVVDGKTFSIIIYPSKARRLSFKALIQSLLRKAIKKRFITEWPEDVLVAGHFLRADLMHFANAFTDFKDKLHAVRNTIVSLETSYGMEVEKAKTSEKLKNSAFKVYDKSNNLHLINIQFYDTMLLAPEGKSLSDIGELLCVPKIEIIAPYSIERMGDFLEGDREAFERYALVDAEITALYLERMRNFCSKHGLKGLPYTVGGIALSLYKKVIKKDLPSYFGLKKVTKELYNCETGKFRTVGGLVSIDDKIATETFAIESYKGGRNESFQMGISSVDDWYDVDVPSCYAVALGGLRELDYKNIIYSTDVNDYLRDVMGMVQVEFNFPKSVNRPSLPVSTDKNGLIYPSTGISWCTAHEVLVAINLGATLSIRQGFILPWKTDGDFVFRKFMAFVRDQRNSYPKGSFEERLWKQVANSLYGKLAQGLKANKTGYDIISGYNKKLPPSAITNAYYATYTTGLVRALMSEMISAIPDDKQVLSVTTDGFATTAPIEEIGLSGPMCTLFRKFYHEIDPNDGEILEVKHMARQLIAMKTRGQLTAVTFDGQALILAKSGTQVPDDVDGVKLEKTPEAHNAYMVDLYLNRFPGQKHDSKSLISTREMFRNQSDLVPIHKKQKLSLEPDFKRQLVKPVMRSLNGKSHLSMQSTPFDSVEDMLYARVRFDVWRKTHCLKILEDWDDWTEFYQMSVALRDTGMRLQAGEDSSHLLLRLFMRAFAQAKLGLSGIEMSKKLLTETLVGWGFNNVKVNQFSQAKKVPLFIGKVPRTVKAEVLAEKLKSLFPAFDVEKLFVE